MTNQCRGVIIPHRDSIWTQNYTLAEITGILDKNLVRERADVKIKKDTSLYLYGAEQNFRSFMEMRRAMLQVLKQDSIYRESIRSVSGSKCAPRRFFIKYGSGCFYPLENYSLQERTYIR